MMLTRRLAVASTLAAAACAATLGCNRSPADHRKPMETPLAPTSDDLEQAYSARDPNMAGHQSAEAVVVGADGITVLCSAKPEGIGDHTWLIHLTGDGTVAWERHYPVSQGIGRAIAALPDGGFAIAGEIRRSPMEFQGYLLHTDANGNAIAGAAFGPHGVTGFNALAVLDDGSVLAVGNAGYHGWLLHADRALHTTWNASLGDVEKVASVAVLPGGFAVAARRELSTTSLDYTWITAFTSDRQVRWQKQLPATGRGEPAAIAALPDGGLIVVGRHEVTNRDPSRTWVVRLDGSGTVIWDKLLGDPSEVRLGTAVVMLPDDGFAVAGAAQREGGRALRLTRLSGDGTLLWDRAYGGEKRDEAMGLARTADGGFVLVGSTMSRGAGKTNVWILKLDGSGMVIWDRVFGKAG
jgi:hypothetical protein